MFIQIDLCELRDSEYWQGSNWQQMSILTKMYLKSCNLSHAAIEASRSGWILAIKCSGTCPPPKSIACRTAGNFSRAGNHHKTFFSLGGVRICEELAARNKALRSPKPYLLDVVAYAFLLLLVAAKAFRFRQQYVRHDPDATVGALGGGRQRPARLRNVELRRVTASRRSQLRRPKKQLRASPAMKHSAARHVATSTCTVPWQVHSPERLTTAIVLLGSGSRRRQRRRPQTPRQCWPLAHRPAEDVTALLPARAALPAKIQFNSRQISVLNVHCPPQNSICSEARAR